MARMIVLDTETTGFSPAEGHRIVEIGCVELLGLRKGHHRQWYIHPDREIPPDAMRVHGITNEMVAHAPRFAAIAREFLEFIGQDILIIHNAAFDMGFLNAELGRMNLPAIPMDRTIDTIPLAKRRFPGGQANLDALCKRLGVDNSRRTFHGALLDAHLLADVYIALNDRGQYKLDLVTDTPPTADLPAPTTAAREQTPARTWPLPAAELAAHQDYLLFLQKESGGQCLWLTAQPGD